MTFKAATCPSCGGALQVPDDRMTVKCMYCGVDVIVRDAIQAASGPTIANLLKLATAARNAGNFPEAFSYYTKVLELDANIHEAWFGKGEAAGAMSTPLIFRLPEMMIGFQAALEHTPVEKKTEVQRKVTSAINDLTARSYKAARGHIYNFLANDDAWQSHLNQVWGMLEGLVIAQKLAPQKREIVEGIVRICDDLLKGIAYSDPYIRDRKGHPLRRYRTVSGQYEVSLRARRNYYGALLIKQSPNSPLAIRNSNTSGGIEDFLRAPLKSIQSLQAKGQLPSFVSPMVILITAIVSTLLVLFFFAGVLAVQQQEEAKRRSAGATSPPPPTTSNVETSAVATPTPKEVLEKKFNEDARRYIAKLRDTGIYPGLVTNVSQGITPDHAKITVSNGWHIQAYQLRLQAAQNLWNIWASIHSPSDVDKARISIRDFNDNEVGGSRFIAGSMIWVQED